MIANFFKKTTNLSLIVTFFVFVCFYTASIFLFKNVDFTLFYFFKKTYILLLFLLFVFLVFFIEQKNSLSLNKGYVSILTVLFLCSFPLVFFNVKIIISNIFLLFAFRRIYSLRTIKNTKEKIYDAAFWIGMASLIHNWSFVYLLLLYVALVLFKKFTFRNAIIPVFGIVTPLFLYFSYALFYDKLAAFKALFHFQYSFHFQSFHPLHLLIPVTIVAAFFIWILIFNYQSTKRGSIEFKTLNSLVVVHLLISCFSILVATQKNGSEFLFILMPFVILLSNYLEKVQEKWFVDLSIILFFTIPMVVYGLQFFSEG